MAGISAIFYYTLIASYSAIEVMREETIQTAEASIDKKRESLSTNNVMTWEEYQPSSSVGQLSPELNRDYNQSSPNEKTMGDSATDDLPMIIQGGKRVTFADEEETESSETLLDGPPSKKLTKDSVLTPSPVNNGKAPKTVVGNTRASLTLTNQKSTRKALIDTDIRPKSKTSPKAEILADTTRDNSPAWAQVTKKAEMKTSELTTRAREYAVALLPNFIAKPNSIKPNTDAEKTEGFQTDAEKEQGPEFAGAANTASTASTASMMADDGLLTSKNGSKNNLVLPVVSEAARIKKMLLAYKQEIDYIRSTVVSLGISQDNLPAAPLSKIFTDEQPNDKDFRNLMIKLAEHRAALRKIPFKPPMLYFYVSSGYGMRKHPKTGKQAFHHGIDLAGTWQENVRTSAPGRIIYAGSEGAFGKVVRVQHEFGVVTTYAHLARITVKLGDYVSEGHVVGKMGNTGRSAGAHLHYEIRVNGKSIDPDKFMKVGRQLSVAGELRQSSIIQ